MRNSLRKEREALIKVTFLGGADEVGASSTLLEIAGKRLLVDCGIRMKARAGDVLPYLEPIEAVGGIDAIILTHAHTDHSGGLPVIHQSYPHIPVYMTPATLSLTMILLLDSLKIMQMEFEKEGEIPLYPLAAVEQLVAASRPVATSYPLEIFGGDIRLTFTPAGHILGASTVLVESMDGTVLMGGDVSVTDQMTIPGMMSPPCLRPDLVVTESTYGGRLHANRAAEEGRLVERAKDVLSRGGGILFPAFAVGRAQEVILILSKAMEQGEIPAAPIFVDGMVRSVCQAYRSYPNLLTPWLRRRLKEKGNPFYPENGPVVPVFKPGLREKYANTRPAIYVSSSGMLTGGPSPYYAKKLAPNKKNCIAITGYQDEESPGRRVQDVARAGGGTLMLYNEEVELKCEVGTYGLSAHADTSQLVNAIDVLEPKNIALVHGDHGAREALENALHSAKLNNVHRPVIGSTLEIQPQTSLPRHNPRETSQGHHNTPDRSIDEFTNEALFPLGNILLERDGPSRNYTVPEILFAFGIREDTDQSMLVHAANILQEKENPFKRDKKRGFLYRLRLGNKGQLWNPEQSKANKQARQLDLNPLLERVSELFPPETGVYRRKVNRSVPAIRLSFMFPKIQSRTQRVQEAIQIFEEETGWSIRIHKEANHQALTKHLLDMLPPDWEAKKNPAIHLEKESIGIKLTKPPQDDDSVTNIKEQFEAETGFSLDVSFDANASITSNISQQATDFIYGNEAKKRMEINQAYQLIKQTFAEQQHQPLKSSLKNQYIELAFISPQIGNRYLELLQKLQARLGWLLRIKPNANQHKIKERAAELIPESWGLKKSPGFHEKEGYLSAKVAHPPDNDELIALSNQMEEETGFSIKLV